MAKQITLEEINRLLEKGKPDTELLKTVARSWVSWSSLPPLQ